MHLWRKQLLDGTSITGTDQSILEGKASWRKTPCTIQSAQLVSEKYSLEIRGTGEYWQSDTYESAFLGKTQRTHRRLERRILDTDMYFVPIKWGDKLWTIEFPPISNAIHFGSIVNITKDMKGKWLVLEIDLRTEDIRWYISEDKV